jgi:hypothetical protein
MIYIPNIRGNEHPLICQLFWSELPWVQGCSDHGRSSWGPCHGRDWRTHHWRPQWLVMGRAGSRLNPHWSLGLRWTKIVWKQEKYGKDRSKLSTTRFCPTWTTSIFTRGFLFGGVTRVLACRILSALARRLLEWSLALWCGWENMEPLGNTTLESQKGCHPCCLRRCTVDGWIMMDRHGQILQTWWDKALVLNI